MVHPLVPKVIDIADPIAQELGLEVVGAMFYTNQKPPVLRIDVRNQAQDTGLDDCERMSRALESTLDEADIIPGAYVLEVSSPGTTRTLESDREFVAFRGFPVVLMLSEPHDGQDQWTGQLVKRDEDAIHLSLKGRTIAIPRQLVYRVQLED